MNRNRKDIETNDQGQAQPRRRARLARKAVTAGLVMLGLSVGTTTLASADVYGTNSGKAMEWVVCDAQTHTVTVNFSTNGNTPSPYQLQGSGIQEIVDNQPLAVWVKIQIYSNGKWRTVPYFQLPYGTVGFPVPMSGESYWYFTYAFANPAGGWDYRSEWTRGIGTWGWYNNSSYNSNEACLS